MISLSANKKNAVSFIGTAVISAVFLLLFLSLFASLSHAGLIIPTVNFSIDTVGVSALHELSFFASDSADAVVVDYSSFGTEPTDFDVSLATSASVTINDSMVSSFTVTPDDGNKTITVENLAIGSNDTVVISGLSVVNDHDAETQLVIVHTLREGGIVDSGAVSKTLVHGAIERISITPADTSMTADATIPYAARARDSFDNQWDVTDSTTFGTTDPWGSFVGNVYSAGQAGSWIQTGNYSGLADTASVTVNHGVAMEITITPDDITVTADDTVHYTAMAEDADGNRWDVTGSTAFSTTDPHPQGYFAANVYWAGQVGEWIQTGNYSGFADTASVTVIHGVAVEITITPDDITVTADDTVHYTATAEDGDGNLWDATGSTVFGTTDPHPQGYFAANVYWAGQVGSWTQTGTYSGRTDFASVTVTHGSAVEITITPDDITVTADDTIHYTATAEDGDGNLWDATGSTVFSTTDPHPQGYFDSNVYWAGQVGSWTQTGTYSGRTDFALVTVTHGLAVEITIAPDVITITADDTVHYTSMATDGDGNLWDATGSTVFSTTDPHPQGYFDANVYWAGQVGSWIQVSTYDIGTIKEMLLDSAIVTVTPGQLNNFVLTPSPHTMTADDEQTFYAQGYDGDGNTVTSDPVWTTAGGITGTFKNQSSGSPANAVFEAVGAGLGTVRATDEEVFGEATVTVNPGIAAHIDITPNDHSITVDASEVLTATVTDSDGNRVHNEWVTIFVDDIKDGELSDDPGNPNNTSGSSSSQSGFSDVEGVITVLYTAPSTAGLVDIIDALSPHVAPVEVVNTVITTVASGATRLVILPEEPIVEMANVSFSITVQAQDTQGNVDSGDASTVKLSSGSTSMEFSIDGFANVDSIFQLSAGTLDVQVRDRTAGTPTVVADDIGGVLISAVKNNIDIFPAFPSGAIVLIPDSDTLTANGVSTVLIISEAITDQYGNVVSEGTQISVSANLGIIIPPEKGKTTKKTNVSTGVDGTIAFNYRAGTIPGLDIVSATSVQGSAIGQMTVLLQTKPTLAYIPGSLDPMVVAPGDMVSFSLEVVNNGGAGVILSVDSYFKFDDGNDGSFQAPLVSTTVVNGGGGTGLLTFQLTQVPLTMDGGSYVPMLDLSGVDSNDASYDQLITTGTSPILSVTIVGIDSIRTPDVATKKDTIPVKMFVRNLGGSSVTVENVDLTFNPPGGFNLINVSPDLPDVISQSSRRTYTIDVVIEDLAETGTVFVDGSVSGRSDGVDFYDGSADYPDSMVIQSAADLSYVTGSLQPDTVTQEGTYSFSLSVLNAGEASVTLNTDTRLLIGEYETHLTWPTVMPGDSTITEIDFVPNIIPLLPGFYVGTIILEGAEGKGHFADTLTTGPDVLVVQEPAQLSHIEGSLTPRVVSWGSQVIFRVQVRNHGGSTVRLVPSGSRFLFDDGNHYFNASLVSSVTIPPEGDATLSFGPREIPEAMAVGVYQPQIQLTGNQNDIAFGDTLDVDSLTVQSPSDLQITSMRPSQPTVTIGQERDWYILMAVNNRGQSPVVLDSAKVQILIGGDVTSEYIIAEPDSFEGSGTDTLMGERDRDYDSLRFVVDRTGITWGDATIEGSIWATDVTSGTPRFDNTENGGMGSIRVQLPPELKVTELTSSKPSVDSAQSVPWQILVAVENDGMASLTLDSLSAFDVDVFVGGEEQTDYVIVPPASLDIGGLTLSGGQSGTLTYRVIQTGQTTGLATIWVALSALDDNSANSLVDSSFENVLVERPARIRILSTTSLASNGNRVNTGQQFDIEVAVENRGEGDIVSAWVLMRTNGSSTLEDSIKTFVNVLGGGTSAAAFHVTAAPLENLSEIFTATIFTSMAENTGQPAEIMASVDSTEVIRVESPAALNIFDVSPSRDVVYTGQTIPWYIFVVVANDGSADLTLDQPSSDDVVITVDSIPQFCIIAAPESLVGGNLNLPGGEIDTLVYTVNRTGDDKGLAAINIDLTGTDNNDDSFVSDSGQGNVIVDEATGVRIVSTTNFGVNAPWINTQQEFDIQVKVQNTDGEVLKNVVVSLASDGQSAFDSPLRIARIESGQIDSIRFAVTASSIENPGEIFTARIDSATGENSGQLIDPLEPLDNTASAIIQRPPLLSLSARITDPPGAIDGSVATNQIFTLKALVVDESERTPGNIDTTGKVTISLPNSYTLLSDTATVSFRVGDSTRWEIRAPQVVTSLDDILIELSSIPNDLNIGNSALVSSDSCSIGIETVLEGTLANALIIDSPLGATDGIVSTDQFFNIVDTVISPGGITTKKDSLILPPGYSTSDLNPREISPGALAIVQWKVRAPSTEEGAPVWLKTHVRGYEANIDSSLTSRDSVSIQSVSRAELAIEAAIVSPSGATDGVVSTGQTFVINAVVNNRGTAGVMEPSELTLDLGETGCVSLDTLVKTAPVDSVVTWTIVAPSAVTPSRVMRVSLSSIPNDENTGEEATVVSESESIQVRTERKANLILQANITGPPGATDGILSTGQDFTITSVVFNLGTAEVSGTAELSLDFSQTGCTSDDSTKPFVSNQPVTWQVFAPPIPTPLSDLVLQISSVPFDVNTGQPAQVQVDSLAIGVATVGIGVIDNHLVICSPPGATDGIVSTDQIFAVVDTVVAFGEMGEKVDSLMLPPGYSTSDPNPRYIASDEDTMIDTTIVEWSVRAPSEKSSPHWLKTQVRGFEANLNQWLTIRDSLQIQAVTKAHLSFSAAITDPPQASDWRVSVNQTFLLQAVVLNQGQAGVESDGARIMLNLGNVGFLCSDPLVDDFEVGEPVTWTISAPDSEINSWPFLISITVPNDENTNQAAAVQESSLVVPISVRYEEPLIIFTYHDQTPVSAARENPITLLSLLLDVQDQGGQHGAVFDTIRFAVEDRNGTSLSPRRTLSSGHLLYRNEKISTGILSDQAMIFDFERLPMEASQTDTFILQVAIHPQAPSGNFRVKIDSTEVIIRDLVVNANQDTSIGRRIGITPGNGMRFPLRSRTCVVMDADFKASLINYPNPFDAGDEVTRIVYYLDKNSALSVRIYTLLGELVWSKDYTAGEPEGKAGHHDEGHSGAPPVIWDGRNGAGELVRNGVYICVVEAKDLDKMAKIKIAVAK